ncbi:MAG: AraC family transcriptional regulator [Clostridiales bacterium]|nr:AraC family transcriptional regulator [Clostridiales bacterium]
MPYEKRHFYRDYITRNEDFRRAPYNPELEFYSAIKTGDITSLRKFLVQPLHEKEGMGKLSDDPLRNMKYHFTVTAALAARSCISCGMDVSTAYDISDYYINKADKARRIEDISDLHVQMCMDYAGRMQKLRKDSICSLHIARCIDYIYDHLDTRITASKLADVCGLSESYLSRLFKQETGQTISDYISDCKITTAQNMLADSDYSPTKISAALAFPSQSYFTSVFRKRTGMTPCQYRTANRRF